MNAVIGDLLPLAVGVAISPMPVIAAILMLLSQRARTTGPAFLVGWVVGIVVAVVLFVLLAAVLPDPAEGTSNPVGAVIKLLLGAGMLLLGIKQWRGRPAAGAEVTMPTWMSAIDTMTAGKALGLGFLLSAVNPKNLLMAMSAGVIIGSAGLPTGQVVISVLVFTVIAASTVLIPVIGYLSASARLAEPLGHLRTWLVANNAAIMAVLLTVIGVVMVGKGIGSF